VGCGSGILAIAAAKLGAAMVLGVDTDPIAVEATEANRARNGVATRIAARAGSLPSGAGPHDVVLANLIASVLIALAPDLRAELRLGGVLLASGIFIDREGDVREAFDAASLEVTTRTAEGEWVALEAIGRSVPCTRPACQPGSTPDRDATADLVETFGYRIGSTPQPW